MNLIEVFVRVMLDLVVPNLDLIIMLVQSFKRYISAKRKSLPDAPTSDKQGDCHNDNP
ncbi:MAG: hypothetical protein LBT06_14535 [Hungatella sp.]|nr:hypothetical protein [Hungatella sp.]